MCTSSSVVSHILQKNGRYIFDLFCNHWCNEKRLSILYRIYCFFSIWQISASIVENLYLLRIDIFVVNKDFCLGLNSYLYCFEGKKMMNYTCISLFYILSLILSRIFLGPLFYVDVTKCSIYHACAYAPQVKRSYLFSWSFCLFIFNKNHIYL